LAELSVSIRDTVGPFSLDVAFESTAGVTALFGPSGAGKSLTLRHLAGLERTRAGRIALGERVLFDADAGIRVRPQDRRVGLVFQEYALFPHLTVSANIGYGLAGRSRAEREERAEALLRLTGLTGFGDRKPDSLSGGQRQRVALARALAPEPEILLLDEPFSALDFRVRAELRSALRTLQEATGVPMVLVTHSLEDVRSLSQELVLLDGGRVVASGSTSHLLRSPPSPEARLLVTAGAMG
jgi:molybdate transport system ATP-binding protein